MDKRSSSQFLRQKTQRNETYANEARSEGGFVGENWFIGLESKSIGGYSTARWCWAREGIVCWTIERVKYELTAIADASPEGYGSRNIKIGNNRYWRMSKCTQLDIKGKSILIRVDNTSERTCRNDFKKIKRSSIEPLQAILTRSQEKVRKMTIEEDLYERNSPTNTTIQRANNWDHYFGLRMNT